MTEDRLLSASQGVRESSGPGPDFEIVEGLFTGEIFAEYQRLTGKSLGKLESWLDLARCIGETPMGKRPLPFKAGLLSSAMRGGLSPSSAVRILEKALDGSADEFKELLDLTQETWFEQFALMSNLWQPGDRNIWSFVFKTLRKPKKCPGMRYSGLLPDAENLIKAVRRDPSLGDFLAEVLARSDPDSELMKNLPTFEGDLPWVGSLFRAVYGFEPDEKPETGIHRFRLRLQLGERWESLKGVFLLPPFLEQIQAGGKASPAEWKLVRHILDTPEILPRRSMEIASWGHLMELIGSNRMYSPVFPEEFETIRAAHENLFSANQSHPSGRPPKSLVWGFFLRLNILIAIAIICAVAIPKFLPRRKGSPGIACYANMRVLLGAVEMYNMEHETKISEFSDPTTIEMLITSRYLKTSIQRPESTCSYSNDGDLAGVGIISCTVHGPAEWK